MIVLGGITAVVVSLVLMIYVAGKFADVAEDKGYDAKEISAFALCFWFGAVGYIYVASLPDRTLQKSEKEKIELLKSIEAELKSMNQSTNP